MARFAGSQSAAQHPAEVPGVVGEGAWLEVGGDVEDTPGTKPGLVEPWEPGDQASQSSHRESSLRGFGVGDLLCPQG